MAVRARPDNLALDHPAEDASALDFQELWEHRDNLRAVSRRLVGDGGTADDVVQETFLRWLTNATRLDRRTSFAPWLATVARRRSLDQLRGAARVRLVAAPPERSSSTGDDPLEQVLRQERFDRVRAALAELSVRERQLLLRQTAHGLSLAELAAEEATSIASVRSVLSRARAKLRMSLERGGPLGAAPVPGLAAAVKRRLHRWAVRFEGSTPMLAGASAQFGDVVAAAVAAAVLLLAGNVPAPQRSTSLTMASASAEQAGEHRPSSPGGPERPEPGSTRRDDTAPHNRRDHKEPDDRPLLGGPAIHLPGMPADGADQPEEVFIEHVAASDDGHTLVISGSKDPAAGSPGGQGLYRSDDGGNTWRQLEAGGFAYGYPILLPGLQGSRTVFVASDPMLLRSDDGGEHFDVVGSSRGGVTALSQDPTDTRIFLAPAGLVAYDARTRETTPYLAAPASASLGGLAVRVSPLSEPTFLVGTARHTSTGAVQGYVQRCTPLACETPIALPGVFQAPNILLSKVTPGLALVWRSGKLYRSTDNGTTFSAVSVPSSTTIHTVVEGAGGELLLARSNPDSSTSSGLLRSTDGGVTWTATAVNTPLQQGALGLAYGANGRIVAGLAGRPGFRCSVDDGVTWAPRCPG